MSPPCPKCQRTDMFDETKSKYWNGGKTKEGKPKPIWKCRDKETCDGVIWPPKPAQQGSQNVQQGHQQSRSATRPLAPLYSDCLALAIRILRKQFGDAYTYRPEDILDVATTMFIAATKEGTPLLPPKAAPKPEPAKPALVPSYSTDPPDDFDIPDMDD